MRRTIILLALLVSSCASLDQGKLQTAIDQALKPKCPDCPACATCTDPAPLQAQIQQQALTIAERDTRVAALEAQLSAVKPCPPCDPCQPAKPNPEPTRPGGEPSLPIVATDAIDAKAATFLASPGDTADWPITTALRIDVTPTGVRPHFSKQDGPDRWPDHVTAGWDGPLQYTLGMCLQIEGRWYCSAVVEFWYGLEESGGPPLGYAENWFYDPTRWAPMTGHQPKQGERIGFYVIAGDMRNDKREFTVRERSNIVIVTMPAY